MIPFLEIMPPRARSKMKSHHQNLSMKCVLKIKSKSTWRSILFGFIWATFTSSFLRLSTHLAEVRTNCAFVFALSTTSPLHSFFSFLSTIWTFASELRRNDWEDENNNGSLCFLRKKNYTYGSSAWITAIYANFWKINKNLIKFQQENTVLFN